MHSAKIYAAVVAAGTFQVTSAVNLYVSSYDGNVTTLSLDGSGENYNLIVSSRVQSCGTQPSWLVFDKPASLLYCMDENFAADPAAPAAVFTSYNVDQRNGNLTVAQTSNLTTASSVSGVMFASNKFMAVAGYSGQVSALAIDGATFSQTQILEFVNKTDLGPGQTSPHPHQTILDPTGKYIVTPDLGGDLLRVFGWNNSTAENVLQELPAFKVKSGSGPRHAAFWKASGVVDSTDDVYLHLVGELDNSLTTYKVAYPQEGGLNFTEVNTQNTFGGAPIPTGARAAEIQVSPCGQFLVVSNRNDSSFSLNRSGGANANVTEFSDSLATYSIANNGELTFKQLWPAGGQFPRQFSINKSGNMVAVGAQTSCRIVILARDIESGLLGTPVAELSLGDCAEGNTAGPTSIIWDE